MTPAQKQHWLDKTRDFVNKRKAIDVAAPKAKAKAKARSTAPPRSAAFEWLACLDNQLHVTADRTWKTYSLPPRLWDDDMGDEEDMPPLLVGISDQCSVQVCAINYVQNALDLSVLWFWGPIHRRTTTETNLSQRLGSSAKSTTSLAS